MECRFRKRASSFLIDGYERDCEDQDAIIHRQIAAALRRSLGPTGAGVNTVAGWTGANEKTVKNWFSGRCGPSGEHLAVLVRHSDEVLNTFLVMAGRQELRVAIKLAEAEQAIVELLVAVSAKARCAISGFVLPFRDGRFPEVGMKKFQLFAFLFISSIVFDQKFSLAEEKEEVLDYSRAQLFAIIRDLEQGQVDMALPSKFRFPDHVRPSAIFGVDVSHHNGDVEWSELAKAGVTFAYVKATEGATHDDEKMLTYLEGLRKTPIFTGAYHFLRSTSTGADQARNFVDALRRAGSLNMPPVIDLEWQLGKLRDDCPQDAIVPVEEKGTKVLKCDLWAFVNYREIISLVNEVADAAKEATGHEPILYSNANWWAARIARPVDKLDLHTRLVWIADYSKDGLATEDPRGLPGADWHLWQFSEGARVRAGGRDLVIDANIFPGDVDAFKAALGF